ncbi:MAG: arsenite methyltransferase [Candidatus Nitrosopolaris sp.]
MQEHAIKEKVKERYGKIALTGNSESCCVPSLECCDGSELISAVQMAKNIGYDAKELESVPETSILGVGCGAPVTFAGIKEGEVVVDIGSGGGIDVFLSANKVKGSGKVIGIDMTDQMLEKARKNANQGAYTNVEFREGDIEKRIPVEDSAVDVAISNCVINLTTDKVSTFKEIYRILKDGGRMIISDLVTDREVDKNSVNVEKWCSCIDGALTKENYLDSIRKAGFNSVQVLQETQYLEDKTDGRIITSLAVKAIK